MRSILLTTALAALPLGCAAAPPRPPAPPLRSIGLDVRQVDLTRFELRARVAVANDAALPWQLQAAQAQVTVDGVLSGADRIPLSQIVPPGQTLELEIPTATDPVHDGNDLKQWAAHGERRIPVVVGGAVQLSDGHGIHDFPFSVVGALRPPKLPIVRVATASVPGGPAVPGATFELSIENPNSFAIPVHAVTCHASVAEWPVVEGFAKGPEQLPAGGTVRYRWSSPLPATVTAGDIERRMARGRLDYRLEGELNLGRLRLPFRFDGPMQAGGSAPLPAG